MQSLIHTPTPSVHQSLDFYKKLDFKRLSAKELHVVTDGKAIIEINPDRYARAGVKLFQKNWKKAVAKIKKMTAVHKIDGGYLAADPSGVWVYMMERESTLKHKPSEKTFSVLGNFAGLSFESTDMVRSAEFWKAVGFLIAGAPEQGWISCASKDGMVINILKPLTCPHLFFNPSLTYFNGKEGNPVVIKNLRKLKIPITEEITFFNKEGKVDNVIIRDPGGVGFFIFND